MANRKVHSRKLVMPKLVTAPTNFDLPIEYHIDYLLKARAIRGRVSKQGAIRLSLFGEKTTRRRSRFENLDPDFLLKRVSIRPSYEIVRQMALEIVQTEIKNKLEIIYNVTRCTDNRHADEELPYKVFSWNRDEFLKRRKVPNTMWVSVLQKEIARPCLEKLKFRIDLENTKTYVELIFAGFMGGGDDDELQEHVFSPVNDASAMNSILRETSAELETNRAEFREKLNTLLSMKYKKRDNQQNALKIELEQKLMIADIYDPIETRYQVNYYMNNANQTQYKVDISEEKLHRQKAAYEELLRKDNDRSRHALNMYFSEIEKFKSEINIMSNQYDHDYDEMDNKLTYTKIAIDKLKEQRTFFLEQIERFKEELEALRLKQLAEEENERRRAAELAAEENLLKAQKKKGKGGKGGKAKKK